MHIFLQEYGVAIVTVIVTLAFIQLAGIFSETITTSVEAILADFFEESGSAPGVQIAP